MKKIKLTQGKVAIVDDEDFEKLNTFKWYAYKDRGTYYARRTCNPARPRTGKKAKTIMMHREILNLPEGVFVDHIDCNGLNNQKDNLRITNHRQNMHNTLKDFTSNYPGVHWVNRHNKWGAVMKVKGKAKYLGLYKNEFDAFLAYRNGVKSLGENLTEEWEMLALGGGD